MFFLVCWCFPCLERFSLFVGVSLVWKGFPLFGKVFPCLLKGVSLVCWYFSCLERFPLFVERGFHCLLVFPLFVGVSFVCWCSPCLLKGVSLVCWCPITQPPTSLETITQPPNLPRNHHENPRPPATLFHVER